MSTSSQLSRRSLLTAAATAGVASLPLVSQAQTDIAAPKRVLRLAHLTDVHIQPERGGAEGLATALRHMQGQADKPELVLFGGDNVMNVDGAEGAARADLQLAAWRDVTKAELGLPFRMCIGNHDVLRNDPVAGKAWAVDSYELPGRYYSFDQSGWQMVVLDSTRPIETGYTGGLDEEQYTWLADLLAKTPADMPVLVLSHIPIWSITSLLFLEGDTSGNRAVPAALMHTDGLRLKNLFGEFRQVKLCLSGHTHLIDQVQYNGVKYACGGAVCGGWWKGPHYECKNGYALIDLYDNGDTRVEYVEYPWTARD